ncbi:PopZ family protein [Mesorhizobium sp. PAMC28654]|uniref:PopZ family protein n=1 Tax=Mesorhizobium sp. PAMC28654 TaxID=2880934 RepID=UPI001D0B9E82|nr:PopZ family protein [Mesorhizobium sp. PAMC28654]UDL90047.1 PopZ family protein [Mesorhizobium sp. PAMC28654]
MATASSAQREPSMEEILASIRRIIEDSDTGRKPAGEPDELRQDIEPESASVQDVDAFRAELRGGLDVRKPVTLAEVQAQLPAAEPIVTRIETLVRSDLASVRAPATLAPAAQAPTTLAEVSARVDAAPAANADMPAVARMSETSDTIVADWRRDIAAVGDAIRASTSLPDAATTRRVAAAEPVVAVPDKGSTVEPVLESAPSRTGAAWPATAEASVRPAIVSEHTGRQVAAAFGELSDAFASRSKKTFDEMAEEMMRPMLQDWLDNNLPTLVERLVREEIERVARGAQ